MAKCTRCGKKGIFLKLDEFGHCEECRQQISAAQQYTPPEPEPVEEPATPSIIFFEKIDNFVCQYLYEKQPIRFADTSEVKVGSIINFEPEPNNEYDENAIIIEHVGEKIGYVARGNTQDMIHDFTKRGWPIEAQIDSIEGDQATYAIAFYKDVDSYKSISTKLVKTNVKDIFGNPRHENLDGVSEGDILHLEYDYESESYLVTDEMNNDLGEIPKALSAKMHEEDGDYKAVCESIEVDDNLKNQCTIKILLPHRTKLV